MGGAYFIRSCGHLSFLWFLYFAFSSSFSPSSSSYSKRPLCTVHSAPSTLHRPPPPLPPPTGVPTPFTCLFGIFIVFLIIPGGKPKNTMKKTKKPKKPKTQDQKTKKHIEKTKKKYLR